ncbi:hypothetical protein [Streptomyces ossamyceticus]|nr:hypothetical protein [Streptomyces ossamyceticus]
MDAVPEGDSLPHPATTPDTATARTAATGVLIRVFDMESLLGESPR